MANSTSHDTVGWVSEPEKRGTASLLYNCLSTIIICIWTAPHQDVRDINWSKSRRLWTRVTACVLAIFGPELLAYDAVSQWLMVKKLDKEMKGLKASVPWSTSLSSFVIMRGVCIRDNEGDLVYLHPDDVYPCFANGWINPSAISAQDIADKSKANWMGKAIACFQIVWLLSQIIGRSASHLPVTTLELSTLAYVLCALVCYAFFWYSPFDVQVPFIVNATSELDSSAWDSMKHKDFHDPWPESFAQYVVLSICCVIYSLPHFWAWNAGFPSSQEHLLWRVSCIACCILPLTISILLADQIPERFIRSSAFMVISVMVLYAVARLYLLVEAFAMLRAVPPEVYTAVPWSQYIPHF